MCGLAGRMQEQCWQRVLMVLGGVARVSSLSDAACLKRLALASNHGVLPHFDGQLLRSPFWGN